MLRAGSPAIDAAAVLAQVTEDFFNNSKVGITPDIGAHEFGGAGGNVYQLTGNGRE
jgi:hypothetical protein